MRFTMFDQILRNILGHFEARSSTHGTLFDDPQKLVHQSFAEWPRQVLAGYPRQIVKENTRFS